MTDDARADEIRKAVDRLRKASRMVGAMALDWMIHEEREARRALLALVGAEERE